MSLQRSEEMDKKVWNWRCDVNCERKKFQKHFESDIIFQQMQLRKLKKKSKLKF